MTEEIKKVDESTSKSPGELAAEAKAAEDLLYDDLTPEEKEAKVAEEKAVVQLNERAVKAGLEEGATEEEIVAKEKEASDSEVKVKELKSRAVKVGLKEDATEDEIVAKEKETPKVVPEKYEIKVPEKSLITGEQLGKIESFAKDRGFSNEEAQAMVESVNGAVEGAIDIYQEAAEGQLKEITEVTWPKEAQEDKEIGGENFESNCELSKRVLKKFGSEKLCNLLDPKTEENPLGTGYGSNPELIRMFSNLGKLMSDDQLVFKGIGDIKENKAVEDVLYDKTE